jgi:hypothetical protein
LFRSATPNKGIFPLRSKHADAVISAEVFIDILELSNSSQTVVPFVAFWHH